MNALELFCDGASGIYIPQRFANEVNRDKLSGVSDADLAILAIGPHEDDTPDHYWDTWADVLDNARLTVDSHIYTLYQDGDLWCVCDDLMTDEEYSDFFGEDRDR